MLLIFTVRVGAFTLDFGWGGGNFVRCARPTQVGKNRFAHQLALPADSTTYGRFSWLRHLPIYR